MCCVVLCYGFLVTCIHYSIWVVVVAGENYLLVVIVMLCIYDRSTVCMSISACDHRKKEFYGRKDLNGKHDGHDIKNNKYMNRKFMPA